MSEQTVSFSVDSGLLNAFVQTAKKNSCNNTELLKGFMAEYVQQDVRRQQYEDWFRGKAEKGLSEIRQGLGLSSEQAEAQMTALRLRKQAWLACGYLRKDGAEYRVISPGSSFSSSLQIRRSFCSRPGFQRGRRQAGQP